MSRFTATITDGVCHFANDLSEAEFERSLKKLNLITVKPTTDRLEWPLFKIWFETNFSQEMPFLRLHEVLSAKSPGSDPIFFGQILMFAIKKFLAPELVERFNDSYGVLFYYNLNASFSNLSGVADVMLTQRLISSMGKKGLDVIAKELQIIGYYIPGVKQLAVYLFLANIPKSDVAPFMKLLKIYTPEDKHLAESMRIKDVYFQYKEFKAESSTNWDEPVEVNHVESKKPKIKARCFKCGKMGHMKFQCKTHTARGEANMVCGLLDEEDVFSEDEGSTGEAFMALGLTEAMGTYYSEGEAESKEVGSFLLDSGATVHIIQDEKLLINRRTEEIELLTLDGRRKYWQRGDVQLSNGLFLRNVIYIPHAPRNIISLTLLNKDGYSSFQKDNVCYLYRGKELISKIKMKNNLYLMKVGQGLKGECNAIDVEIDEGDDWMTAHRACGHASKNQLKTLGVNADAGDFCNTCAQNVSLTKGRTDGTEYQAGELIHVDLIGPMANLYALVSIDHHSKTIIGYTLKRKSEASQKAIAAVMMFSNLMKVNNKTLCYLRADNEFDTKAINQFCESKGINLQFTAPHSSHQNGNVENANGYLKRKMKLLLADSGLDRSFWPYAFRHAIFLHNYLPRNQEKESPWTKLTGKTKTLKNLYPFGCLIFFYNYENDQKIFTQFKSGVFLGYDNSTQIACVYDVKQNKIIRTSAFNGLKEVFPLRRKEWYEEELEHSGAPQKREGYTQDNGGDHDTTDRFNELNTSSHVGMHGSSLGSWQGLSLSSSPPDTRLDASTSAMFNPADKVLENTVSELDEGSEYRPNESRSESMDVDEEEATEGDDMDIDQPETQSTELEVVNSKEQRLTTDKAPQVRVEQSVTKDQPAEVGGTVLEGPQERLLLEDKSFEDDGDQDRQLVVSNRFAAAEEKERFALTKEYQELSLLHHKHADQLSRHYEKLLNQSNELFKLSSAKMASRPTIIPYESGILPVQNAIKQKMAQELVQKPAAGPLTVPKPAMHAPKRPDLNMGHIGAAKRRVQEGSSFELVETTAGGQRAAVSKLASKHYVDLKNKERNAGNVTERSSYYQVPATTTLRGEKHQELDMDVDSVSTSDAVGSGVESNEQNLLPSSNVYKQILDTSTSNDEMMDEVNVLVEKMKYVIPTTYKQAMRSPQAKLWKQAAEEEFNSMNSENVYTLMPRKKVPKNALIVQSRWVFNVKVDEKTGGDKFKGRIVAKGFTQEKGVNYIERYAPVMRFETLRLVIALTALNKWDIIQLDAKNAFLNGKLDYDVFLEIPPGTTKGEECVWKLHKSLYGLKQSPRIWYLTVEKVLLDNGFQNSVLEPCLFWKKNCLLILYVDDILIAGKTNQDREDAAGILKKNFIMKDLGSPKVFLGITIRKLKNNEGFTLSLEDSISRVENDFGISTTERMLNTPIAKGFDKQTSNSPLLNEKDHRLYRSLIGTLLFFANTVRLDISFSVSYFSRFLEAPTEYHMKGAKRVMQYVIQTKGFRLVYGNQNPELKYKDFRYVDKTEDVLLKDYPPLGKFKLVMVSDSDWAGDIADRKSQSGNIVLLNGNVINWNSTKQTGTAGSTAESEYISISDGLKDALSFKNILAELKIKVPYIDVVGDNQSALTLASHNTQHKRTKHIDIRYHFIRGLVKDKLVKLNYIHTKDNIADILTKFLDTTTHKELIQMIGKM